MQRTVQASSPPTPEPQTANAVARAMAAPVILQSRDLLGSRQAIDIEHNGQRYRLQTTKAGKLILTK